MRCSRLRPSEAIAKPRFSSSISTAVRRTLKARLARLEKQSVSPKYVVLWVNVHDGETHEGVIKTKYGNQIPPGVELVTVSWMPQEEVLVD